MHSKTFPVVCLIMIVSSNFVWSQQGSNAIKSTDMDTTMQVLEHHFKSFRANDLEETMSDYTEESIFVTPDREFKGLAEIRELFINAYKAYPSSGTTIVIDKMYTTGTMGYVVWHGETPAFKVPFSTATYIIENGKIMRHTIGRVTVPK